MKEKWKKGKAILVVTIGIACFALTLVMTMQFKIVNETDITSIETMRETELRTELANWKEKYQEASEKYDEIYAKVEEYKKNKQSNEETNNLMENELKQINLILGKTDVFGQGIEVIIKENQNEEIGEITSDDLLVIVNNLKAAGAEAISINDERIVNMSDMATIRSSFIKVNGQRIIAPFVIKAIGNQTYLESALVGSGGYVDELKKIGHDVSIEKINRLVITKYRDEMKIKYIQE